MIDAWSGETREVLTLDTSYGLPSGDYSARPCWKVLVVEDDPIYRNQLVSGLLDAGLAVAWFTRGSEALESIHHDSINYDLVIADMQGSDLTGLELARALRAESPCTRVLFLATAEQLPAFRASTKSAVLAKPFELRHVLETVDSLCGAVRPRILVADDDASIRLLVQLCLSSETYDVIEVEDGLQACEALQRAEFQLLIVDLAMPGHEGLETIRSICRRGHKLKILAIPGQRPEYLKVAGLLGADATLKKPFTLTDLRTVVARLLEGNESGSD